MPGLRERWRGVGAVACAFLFASCAFDRPGLQAQGVVGGHRFETTVDAPIAKYYLERYLPGHRENAAWDPVLDAIGAAAGPGLPSAGQLREWSREHSADLATLVLTKRLLDAAEAHPVHLAFRRELDAAIRARRDGTLGDVRVEPGTLIVFVPGWLYASDTTTGADFARIRSLLARHGARTLLVETGENDAVERNARIIAATIRRLAATEKRLLVVSSSKGGAETALALSALRHDPAASRVKAWLNIGGLLRGSRLAIEGLEWPACWYLLLFVLPDRSFDGVRSLASLAIAPGHARFAMPPGVLVVNYLGVPLSGQVTPQGRAGYERLRNGGPNDGFTHLLDAIVPGALTIPEPGLDHFLRDPDFALKALALARVLASDAGEAVAESRRISHPSATDIVGSVASGES